MEQGDGVGEVGGVADRGYVESLVGRLLRHFGGRSSRQLVAHLLVGLNGREVNIDGGCVTRSLGVEGGACGVGGGRMFTEEKGRVEMDIAFHCRRTS